jgi:hypothetical protein
MMAKGVIFQLMNFGNTFKKPSRAPEQISLLPAVSP